MIAAPEQSAGEDVDISTDGKIWTRIGQVIAAVAEDLPAGGLQRYLGFTAWNADAGRPLVIGDVVATGGAQPMGIDLEIGPFRHPRFKLTPVAASLILLENTPARRIMEAS